MMLILFAPSGVSSTSSSSLPAGLGTWGYIMSSQLTWSYMAGNVFSLNSTQATVWTTQTVATQNCP